MTRNAELRQALYDARLRLGLSAAPDAAHALLRGLKTLDARLRRQTETAADQVFALGDVRQFADATEHFHRAGRLIILIVNDAHQVQMASAEGPQEPHFFLIRRRRDEQSDPFAVTLQ